MHSVAHKTATRTPHNVQHQQHHLLRSMPRVPRHRRQPSAAAASAKEGDVLDFVPLIAAPFAQLIDTPLYYLAEGSVLLAMLALVDAGYSGDWSRIGVIDPATEPLLQRLAQVFWSLHVVSGLVAARVAQQQGRSITEPFVKGFLFGLLGVFEQIEWDLYVVPRQLGRTLGKRVTAQAVRPPGPAGTRTGSKSRTSSSRGSANRTTGGGGARK